MIEQVTRLMSTAFTLFGDLMQTTFTLIALGVHLTLFGWS